MKTIIFGINGQDGFYLKKHLTELSHQVIGVSRSLGEGQQGNVANISLVNNLIQLHQPEYVFHLAANSTTNHASLFENHETIATGTLNILEAVYKYSPKTKVFLSGSAVQFENNGMPISERTPFAPLSPYAVSRIQSVYAARYYRDSLGLKVYVGYFFNHDSPLRSERHVNQKILQTLKRISLGSKEELNLFDITVCKEFGYAGDVVDAIWKLVQNETIFEAVIGTGVAHSIEDWLNICGTYLKLDWKNYVTTQKDFKKEYQVLVSNPKIIKSLGWNPRIDTESLAKMMIENEY